MDKSKVMPVDEVNRLRSRWPATYTDLAYSHEALRAVAIKLAAAADHCSASNAAQSQLVLDALAEARATGLLAS